MAEMYAWESMEMAKTVTHSCSSERWKTSPKNSTAGGDDGRKACADGSHGGKCGESGDYKDVKSGSAKTPAQKKTGSSTHQMDSSSSEESYGGKSGQRCSDEGGNEGGCKGGKDGGVEGDTFGDERNQGGDGNVFVMDEEMQSGSGDVDKLIRSMFHIDLVSVPWGSIHIMSNLIRDLDE